MCCPVIGSAVPSSTPLPLCVLRKPDLADSDSVLEAFKFIESAAAEFSDEDEDEDGCFMETVRPGRE